MKVLYFNKETSKRRISKDNKGFYCYLKEGKKKFLSQDLDICKSGNFSILRIFNLSRFHNGCGYCFTEFFY